MMGLGRAFGGMKMRSRRSRGVRVVWKGLGRCYYRDIWSVQHCGGVIGMGLDYQSSNFMCGNLLSSGLVDPVILVSILANLFLIVIRLDVHRMDIWYC